MRTLACLLVMISLAVFPPFEAGAAETAAQKAFRILDQVDDLWRGSSSHTILSMRVQTEHYTRSMQMEAWSKGKDQSLVRILMPLKEKDTATLKSGNNIYTYLPRTDRTIRLTSGMMLGSWMGSHFTNDDLVKESRMSEDYAAALTFEGEREGEAIIELTLNPRPDAAVVWGKIIVTVRQEDFIPVQSIYFDEDGAVVRTMIFSNTKMMGGRLVPAVLRLNPIDKPDEYTELVYEKMTFDQPLDESFFSLSNLRHK